MKLHRSLVFWAGVMVMGFIVWAWNDSILTRTRAGHRKLFFGQERSMMFLSYYQEAGVPGGWGFEHERIAEWASPEFVAAGIRNEKLWGGGREVVVGVPHYGVLLVAAGLWLTLLARRERRVKRARIGTEGGEG
jgi:hypothetical protein